MTDMDDVALFLARHEPISDLCTVKVNLAANFPQQPPLAGYTCPCGVPVIPDPYANGGSHPTFVTSGSKTRVTYWHNRSLASNPWPMPVSHEVEWLDGEEPAVVRQQATWPWRYSGGPFS